MWCAMTVVCIDCGVHWLLQVANPLGVARGKHQLGVFMFSIVNLDANVRTTPGYIQIAGIVLEKDVKRWGPLRTFAGVDPVTRKPDPKLWATPGAQLRAFHAGISMNLPISTEATLARGWALLVIADMLAAHKLNCFVESPSAYCPCRECDWDTRKEQAYEPVGFLREGKGCRWKPYTTEGVELALQSLRSLPTNTAREKPMQDLGVNCIDHALSPDYIPHFRFVEGTPQVVYPPAFLACHPLPCLQPKLSPTFTGGDAR